MNVWRRENFLAKKFIKKKKLIKNFSKKIQSLSIRYYRIPFFLKSQRGKNYLKNEKEIYFSIFDYIIDLKLETIAIINIVDDLALF